MTMFNVTVGPHGEINLPEDLRARHGLVPDVPIRVVETRAGLLIVPLHDGPMSVDLARELADWQALGAEGLAMFPYETDES